MTTNNNATTTTDYGFRGLLPAAEAALEAVETAEMSESQLVGHGVDQWEPDEVEALKRRASRLIEALSGYRPDRIEDWAKAQKRGRASRLVHCGARCWHEPGTGPWRVVDANLARRAAESVH